MIRTERTEIIPKLTLEIIVLKFTRTKNDPYWTELDPNIFYIHHFSFQEKLIEPKISWPEVNPNWNRSDPKPNPNRTKMTRPEANPNRMTRLLGLPILVHFSPIYNTFFLSCACLISRNKIHLSKQNYFFSKKKRLPIHQSHSARWPNEVPTNIWL